jgi:hypothetical protein
VKTLKIVPVDPPILLSREQLQNWILEFSIAGCNLKFPNQAITIGDNFVLHEIVFIGDVYENK